MPTRSDFPSPLISARIHCGSLGFTYWVQKPQGIETLPDPAAATKVVPVDRSGVMLTQAVGLLVLEL
jgi:hypothetical protein